MATFLGVLLLPHSSAYTLLADQSLDIRPNPSVHQSVLGFWPYQTPTSVLILSTSPGWSGFAGNCLAPIWYKPLTPLISLIRPEPFKNMAFWVGRRASKLDPAGLEKLGLALYMSIVLTKVRGDFLVTTWAFGTGVGPVAARCSFINADELLVYVDAQVNGLDLWNGFWRGANCEHIDWAACKYPRTAHLPR